MITIVRIDNPFEPFRRETSEVEFEGGMTTADICKRVSVGDLVAGAVGHNGAFLSGGEVRELKDGDFVTVLRVPGGPWKAFFDIVVLLLKAWVVGKIAQSLMPKIDVPEDPDSTYSYLGFQNNYTPEGSPVPVVYGTMRVAPPCINQSILGGSSVFVNALLISSTETMNSMYAISEGPIRGIGAFKGIVRNDEELNTVVAATPGYDLTTLTAGMGLQINGMDAQALDGDYVWRTGSQDQEAIRGTNGFVDPTYPSTTYPLVFVITAGTNYIDGSASQYPSGLYDYVDRIGGSSSSTADIDTTQFVSLQLTEVADVVNVQAFFPKGLYTGMDDGTPNNETVRLRVQYWETDSSGTALSQVVILDPIQIVENTLSPFSADLRFSLWGPLSEDYTPSVQGGYFRVDRASGSTRSALCNNSPAGIALLSPTGANGFTQKFSGAAWIQPRNQNQNNSPSTTVFYCGSQTGNVAFQTSRGIPVNSYGYSTWAPNEADLTGTASGWALTWSRVWYGPGPYYHSYGGFRPTLMCWQPTPGRYARYTCGSATVSQGGWHTGNITADAPPWFHIGFTYDATKNIADRVRFYVNGSSYGAHLATEGGSGNTYGARPWWPTDGIFNVIRYASARGESSGTPELSQDARVCGAVLYDGILSSSWFNNAYWSRDVYGQRNFLPSSMEGDPNALLLMDTFTQVYTGDPHYVNFAYPDATTGAAGAMRTYETGGSFNADSPSTGSPLWNHTVGTVVSAYYKVEVFKDYGSGPSDTTDRENGVTIDSITTFSSESYSYPTTAVLAVSITAAEEVNNSTPEITMLVHGKIVSVCTDPTGETPAMSLEFSSNPAWVALDMLTNRQYGMGEIFSPNGTYELIDLQTFYDWALFCDEGVQDGYGEPFFFGLRGEEGLAGTVGTYDISLYFGLLEGGSGRQEIPATWVSGHFVSIKTVTDAMPDFVTAADVEGGLNNASNMLEIESLVPATDEGGFHGWNSYVQVRCIWNRRDGGNISWPDGHDDGDAYWADELVVASTNLAAAITATTGALEVDDIAVFSGLDFDPTTQTVKYYARITDASTGAVEDVEIWDVYTGSPTAYVYVYRGQLGTSAVIHAIDSTIELKSGAFLGAASGFDTRCSFDGVFDQKNTAGWDALLQVFQTGRAMPVKVGARILAVVDQPRDPVALFTQANIMEGSFQLTYMGIRANPNSLVCSFLNEDRNYEKDTVIIDHPSTWVGPDGTGTGAGTCTKDQYTDQLTCEAAGGIWTAEDFFPASFATRRQETLEARGVTRRNQVTRDATYRLNRYYLQRRAATFDVGPDSIHLLPGDRILVSHDTPQYGYSGRIPEGGTWSNSWPSGGPDSTDVPNIYEAFGDPGDTVDSPIPSGGPMWKGQSNMANILQPAGEGISPPLTGYTSPVTMFRGTIMDGTGHLPAGNAASGYPTATFDADKNNTGGGSAWANQFGYPTDSGIVNNGVDVDVIESTTHKSCFSVYVKEPAKGAVRGLRLNIYRAYNATFDNASSEKQSYTGIYMWDGSGDLITVSTPAAGVTQAVEEIGSEGWWRASVSVDWSAITDITPAEAVGWHLQPRLYTYDYQDSGNNGYDGVSVNYGLWRGVTVDADGNGVTWNDADNGAGSCSIGGGAHTTRAACNAAGGTWTGTVRRGRGNQFLAYADPMELEDNLQWDGDGDGTATDAWPLLNNVPGADPATSADNRIWSGPSSSSAPPFYPEAKKADAGGTETPSKYGMVQHIWAGREDDADKLSFKQVIDLNVVGDLDSTTVDQDINTTRTDWRLDDVGVFEQIGLPAYARLTSSDSSYSGQTEIVKVVGLVGGTRIDVVRGSSPIEALEGDPVVLLSSLAGGSNWLRHFDRFNGREGYGNFEDEPMILSFFFKLGGNGSETCKFKARLMFDDSVDANGLANGDYAEVAITIPTSGSTLSFAYTLNNASGASHPGTIDWAQYNTTGATTYSGDATYAEKVRQNSTTNDSDWYYVRIAVVNDTDFRDTSTGYSGHLGVQFIMGSSTGSDCTAGNTAQADLWGVNLRGLASDSTTEGGAGTTVRYYNLDKTGRYRGINLWGMMYENGVDTPSDFTIGSLIKLDRDVSVEAGKEYEVYVRSSTSTDSVYNTDLQEVLSVSSSEIPASGTTVIPARTLIETSLPTKFLPGTGDLYSFGETGKTTEDFYITSIDTDPTTLVRTIECIEYNEGIYNDANWGILGDATVSSLPSPGGDENAEYGMGGGNSSNPEGLNFHAELSGYRGPSGEPIPAIWLRWSADNRNRAFQKARIYVTQLDDTAQDDSTFGEGTTQLVATVPASSKEYRYDGFALKPDRRYRFRLQPVGWKGTSRALRKCVSIDVTPVTNPPTPSAPTLTATLHGKKQMYKVAQTGTARDYAIEGRIGGWLVSTPAWIIDPNTDRFISEGLLPVPTNAAGSTQATVYARPKLLNGSYGNAAIVLGTEAMVDVRASRQVIAEDDYSAVQASITTELQVVAGTTETIRWNPSSTSVAEQTYKMTEIDATTPRRTVVNAIIEGTQLRPETFEDFGDNTLGSEIGRNWSIEGPMKDDGYNGTVEIQWRWTSGGTLTGVSFRPFEPGEIYARKVQFQLVFNRAEITGLVAGSGYANTQVTRFTIIENDLPSEHFVDGGTF